KRVGDRGWFPVLSWTCGRMRKAAMKSFGERGSFFSKFLALERIPEDHGLLPRPTSASAGSKTTTSSTHGDTCAGSDLTRFQPSKNCPRTECTLENCGSPTLRLGKGLDFSPAFCPRYLFAWPATLQIMLKNDAK